MERDLTVDLGVDVRMILKSNCRKLDGDACTGLIWLRIRTVGGLL